jgi:hypothetical protein
MIFDHPGTCFVAIGVILVVLLLAKSMGVTPAVSGLICGALLTIYSACQIYLDQKFDGVVVHGVGTVDDLSESHGKGTSYIVSYHYDSGRGEIFAHDAWIAKDEWLNLHVASQLPIKYLPGMPEKSRVDYPEVAQHHWRMDTLFAFGGVVILCMSVYKWRTGQ